MFSYMNSFVWQVIRNLLGDDADMLSLYLTHPDRQEGQQVLLLIMNLSIS